MTAPSPFDQSGVAAQSDFQLSAWRSAYDELLPVAREFEANAERIRSREYRWPADPLHTWSRIWEYPYVLHQFRRRALTGLGASRVADIGSGVTFFPFALARDGMQVTCTDTDPVCAGDLGRAARVISTAPGNVLFVRSNGASLPMETGSVDVVYCISVIEHVTDPAPLLQEIHRVLAPGGTFVFTVDLDLRGDAEVGTSSFGKLRATIGALYNVRFSDVAVHPADVLTTRNSPYPLRASMASLPRRVSSAMLSPLVGRARRYVTPSRLSVYGASVTKQ